MLVIHKESHVDHSLTQSQVKFILERFQNKDAGFIETFELPENLGTVPCSLYGPATGDDPVSESQVVYQNRGSRPNASRLLIDGKPRPTRTVTVIAGAHDGLSCVWFTAFGGPLAPKEPGDPYLKDEEREASVAFWKEHALAQS